MKRVFTVKALWDDEAQVFYAQSDIEGLHIEAASLDEFEEIMLDAAPELILVNHRSASEYLRISLERFDTEHSVAKVGDGKDDPEKCGKYQEGLIEHSAIFE